MDKIKLFRRRTFGEVIGTTFDLLRENFKLITSSYAIFVMPFVMIFMIVSGISFSIATKSDFTAGILFTIGFPCFLIALLFEGIVLHEIIKAYEGSDTPKALAPTDIWTLLRKDAGKIVTTVIGLFFTGVLFLMVVAIVSLIFYAAVLAVGSSVLYVLWLFFLLFIPLYFNVCMSHFIELRLRDDMDVLTASIRSMTITFRGWRWAKTMGVYLIMMAISFSFYSFSLLPFGIIIFFFRQHVILPMSDTNAEIFARIYLCIFMVYSGIVFSYVYHLVLLGSTINYFSIIEEKEHVGLRLDISSIGLHQTLSKVKEAEY